MADHIIENIIVTAEIKQQLPLQTLSVSIPNTEFQEQDPVLIFRFDHPRRVVFLTEKGTISCTGVISIDQGRKTIYQVIEILTNHAIPIQHIPDVQMQSFVISMNWKRPIDLDQIQKKLPSDQIIYNPQRNPWIEYLYDQHITFLICSSGIIVCTGSCSFDHVDHAIDMLSSLLE